MAHGSRTRLDPERRRAQLVDLGRRMLSSRPLDQVAIDDIAAEAGISRGLLFHYFPTKRDFHVAVARSAAHDLLARIDAAGPTCRRPNGCGPGSRPSSTT
ncbi:MAG TPA: helix-turn-helix domain-containing protein [Acidimicrobiales bacterium]